MSLRGTKQSRTVQIRPVEDEIASFLLIRFRKNVCYPEERRIFFALLITDFYSEEDASCLRMTSYKKGSHPELVSGPHRTGYPPEVYSACGVPKQVRHDGGVKAIVIPPSEFLEILQLRMTSYKKGSHPELVSGPHRTGFPHEVRLASGMPKQVRHDSGVKGVCHPQLHSPRILKLETTWQTLPNSDGFKTHRYITHSN